MSLEIIFAAIILILITINYYLAERNGRLKEKDRQRSGLLEAQASAQRTLDAQISRYDERVEKMEKVVYGKDIHLLSDSNDNNELNALWKADPNSDIQTNPESVEKPKTEGT